MRSQQKLLFLGARVLCSRWGRGGRLGGGEGRIRERPGKEDRDTPRESQKEIEARKKAEAGVVGMNMGAHNQVGKIQAIFKNLLRALIPSGWWEIQFPLLLDSLNP